jgi:putative oxidoreductase
MSTVTLLEIFLGFLAATTALWALGLSAPSMHKKVAAQVSLVIPSVAARSRGSVGTQPGLTESALALIKRYVTQNTAVSSAGLLLLRLAIGGMMIHHGQEKLADPATFATNYVVPLHLPFPLFFAHVAGLSEVLGSWCVILGFLTPLGALALTSTMAVAGYSHILTSGFNIYVLELVVLYLGGSLGILLIGPGRFSLDALLVSDWFKGGASRGRSEDQGLVGSEGV